jgi:hypothetical protein
MFRQTHGRLVLRRLVLGVSIAVWALAVSSGLWILLRYSNTPGAPATPPGRWPSDAPIQRAKDRPTLLVFAHPQCPCTVASIDELARIVAEAHGKLDAYVLFYAPEQRSSTWVRTAVWRSAAAVPGLHLVEDRNGVEARRFRVATSGQALLYDVAGNLRFDGGITASRGHSGGNDGRDAIVSIARQGSSPRARTPVFGCGLLGDNR